MIRLFVLFLFIFINVSPGKVIKEVRFENVELRTVVRAISEVLDLNVIIDPEISEALERKTTVVIKRPMNAEEVFNAILKEHGLIAVRVDGEIYKITKAGEVTLKFKKLGKEEVETILQILKPLVSSSAQIVIDKKLGEVTVWDEERRIVKIKSIEEDIRNKLKKEEEVKYETRVFYLKKNIPVLEAEKLLKNMQIKDLVVKVSPEFNALIVTTRREDMKKVEEVLGNLKERTELTKPVITKVLYLKYVNAETFKRLIQDMLSDIGEVYILGKGIAGTAFEERKVREIRARIEKLTEELKKVDKEQRKAIEAQIKMLLDQEKALKEKIKKADIAQGDELDLSGFPEVQLGKTGPEFKKKRSARTLFANAVVIRDYVDVIYRIMERYKDIISEEPVQIRIRARIVEINKEYLREIGLNWGMFFSQARVPQFWQGGVGANASITGNLTPTPLSPDVTLGTNAGGILAFSYQRGILNALNLKLSALERIGKAKSLSQPTVYTLNGEPAIIQQALEFPIVRVTVSGNAFTASAEYKVIPLILSVTPILTPDNKIMLDITIAKQEVIDFVSIPVSANPPITQEFPVTVDNRMDTKVIVNNGDMIVIGGILSKTEKKTQEGFPGLMRVPLLGWLFKQEQLTDTDKELLIFIQPELISGG